MVGADPLLPGLPRFHKKEEVCIVENNINQTQDVPVYGQICEIIGEQMLQVFGNKDEAMKAVPIIVELFASAIKRIEKENGQEHQITFKEICSTALDIGKERIQASEGALI